MTQETAPSEDIAETPLERMLGSLTIAQPHALTMRDKVNIIEAMIFEALARGDPSIEKRELPNTNYFSQGVYAREMFIPKGTVVTGKLHKYQQLNVLLFGDLSVLTEDGIKRVKPPFVIVSPPGTKRIAYAHEDSSWLTVHGTDETDVDKIEAHFIAQSDEEYEAFLEQAQVKEIA